jgi:PAS domain S-box-containing protein
METELYKSLEEEIQDLRSKEERLNFILDNSIDVLWELDRSLRFIYVSSSLPRHVGYTQEEWLGHRISEFTTWREFIKMAREALYAIKNFRTFDHTIFETFFFHKNGEPIYFEIIGKVMFNKKGFPIGVMGSTRNITERKKTEQNLRESELKLKQINATKDKLFSLIAHDLKSPFSGMLGLSDLLYNDFENYAPEKQREFIGLINLKIEETYKLLDNLLLWTQSQRGTITVRAEQINLNSMSCEILNLQDTAVRKKSIHIINQIPPDFFIYGDYNILSTVFRNLLTNAIKFTSKHGEITLNTNLKYDKRKSKFVEISIADNGVGIPKEKLDHLFSIDSHISTKGTDNESGSGLGLPLCKELLTIHNGDIWAESEEGKGSSFVFTIPINK